MADIEAQVKEAGEAVRLMKEANKAAPGTHSKVCVVRLLACLRVSRPPRCTARAPGQVRCTPAGAVAS